MPSLEDMQSRVQAMQRAKAVAEDRKRQAEQRLTEQDKECRKVYGCEPSELGAKIAAAERELDTISENLMARVSEMERAVAQAQ